MGAIGDVIVIGLVGGLPALVGLSRSSISA
jgi:hypothetical protein